MKTIKCFNNRIFLGVLIFVLFSSLSTVWGSDNQIIYTVSSVVNAYTDQCFEIDLMYAVSNDYTNLNGVGIMLHYDTDFFANPTLTYSTTGIVGSPYISDESINDDDGDSATDKTFSVAWYDHNTSWPGVALPIKLCSIRFTTVDSLSIDSQSILRITPTSTHLGYSLYAEPITVTIALPSFGPVVDQPIDDIFVEEDAVSQSIDLSPVFRDINHLQVVKNIQSNSNPSLVSTTIENETLILNFLENQNGSAEIVIIAISNGKSVSDTFTITVNAVDDPPFVANEISNIIADENANNVTINLSNVFSDVDNTGLIKSILANSNPTLISANIIDDQLTIEFLENQYGEAHLTINAVSNGKSISDIFTITVNATPPVAEFYAEQISGNVPLEVHFINTSQNEFTSAQWQFGDNSKSSAISPIHTYSLPGQYTVCLEITGPGGTDKLTKTAYIQVNEGCDLSVQFSANQRTAAIQTEITMTSFVSENVTDLLWDFGDGITSQEKNPTHSYSTPGQYNVSLTATGSVQGCSMTKVKTEYIQITGRSITGQVLADGNGMPGFTIDLWDNESRKLDSVITDENGGYTFDNLPAKAGLFITVFPPSEMADQYKIQFYPDAIQMNDAERVSTQTQDLQIDIDLIEPQDNGISGQVLLNSSGVANAMITVYSEELNHVDTEISDEQGNYTITGLPMADDYIVSAYIETINQEYYYAIPQDETPGNFMPTSSVTRYSMSTPITPADPLLQHINMIVKNETIRGTVLSDGHPVSNVQIYAWSNEMLCGNFSATNVNGQYTITGLIAVSEADAPSKGYFVELQSNGCPYQVYHDQTDIEMATRVATDRTDIDFHYSAYRQVSGRVTDTNNNAISDAFIHIESKSTQTKADFKTDETGLYTFTQLPLGSDYILYAYVSGYPLQYYKNSDNADQATPIDVYDHHAENIDFVMDKGSVIKGQVIFLENGQPVPEGIFVNVSSGTLNSGRDEPTDSNGFYEFTGLDSDIDDYIVSIWNPVYVNVFYSSSGSVYRFSHATPIAPSNENRNLTLTPGYCIQGEITSRSVPIEGIKIWAEGPTTGHALSISSTVNTPNYEICGLVSGSYEVSISSDQYLNDSYPDPVIIDANNQTNIDFQLNLPTRTLSGTIYQADQNETIRLFATSSNGSEENISKTGTGAPLSFTFSNLQPASDYRLEIRADNHDYQVYNNKTVLTEGTKIDLSTENANGIEITLIRSSGKIQGVVQFPEPLVKNNSVWLTTSCGWLSHEIIPQESGGDMPYTLTGLGLSTECELHLISNYYEQQVKIINTDDALPDNDINFVLTPGGSISGQIRNANNEGIAGAIVMVFSDNSGEGGEPAETDLNGNYQVGGLNAASDYYVYVKEDSTHFYYHSNGTVSLKSRKGLMSLSQGQNITGIDIQTFDGEKIEGTVRNADGSPLANVYISVELGQDSAGSDMTDQQGRYLIDNLQANAIYRFEATPNQDSGYINQIKENIQTNRLQVDFVLQKGYTLSGQVLQWNLSPVENATIRINSISKNIFPPPVKSDNQGNFEILGLASASDYFLQVTPEHCHLSEFKSEHLMIDDHNSLHITLSPALSISGAIKVSGDEVLEYTQTAQINIYSSDGFNQWTQSQNDAGSFMLCHVPDTSKYTITVSTDNYADQSVYQVFPGENVDIILSANDATKKVFGYVKNSRGQPISGARVELNSSLVNIPSQLSQDDGWFQFEKVPELFNGLSIRDYSLLVTASGYPDARKSNIPLNTAMTIFLETDDTMIIDGTVNDVNNTQVPTGYNVIVRIYEKKDNSENAAMKEKKQINDDGTFKFEGLNVNSTYSLKFILLSGDNQKLKEWAGENNQGVEKKKDAIFYSPGETVNFRFSEEWP